MGLGVGASSANELMPDETRLSDKPRLRGIPDVVAAVIALPAAFWIVHAARSGPATLAAGVYGATLVTLFTVSGMYHAPRWPLAVRVWMRRLDHASIFFFIAGCYAPLCLATMSEVVGERLLLTVWIIAACGALVVLLFPHAPRQLRTACYLVLGFLLVPQFGAIYATAGALGFALFGTGGILYTVGAVVYARRWPNPWPKTFGYHELFHALIIVACTCHYILFVRLLG